MGAYVPKIESPITGQPQPDPTTGTMCRQDEENVKRFNGWFRVASKEQLVSFWAICLVSIIIFSVLAYATVYGRNVSEDADFDFIKGEGEVIKDTVGSWFGTFFWIFGSISLVLVALGVVDYVARLVADVLKTLHLRDDQHWSESKIYASIVWTMCTLGVAILLTGFDAPLVLLVLRVPERHRDVHLLDAADQAQPDRPAARSSGPGPPARRAGVRGPVLRLLRQLVRDRPDGRAVLDATTPVRPLRRLRRHVHGAVRGGVAARAAVRLGTPLDDRSS